MDWGSVASMVGSSGGGSGGSGGGFIGADPKTDSLLMNSLYQSGKNRQDSVEDAQRQMGFQREMYGSRYQMQVRDLEAAGLNPILAASQGAPGAPGGASPSSYPDPSGPAHAYAAMRSSSAAASMASLAAQRVSSEVELNQASASKLSAEALTERNRPENVQADTAVKRAQVPQIVQNISESAKRIEKLGYDMEYLGASADVQRAMHTKIHGEIDVLEQQVTALKQSNKANLPEVQRWIKDVEKELMDFRKPGAFNEAAMQESFLGRFSTLLKGLSPIVR
jgi:hypothetical protein